MNMVSDLTIAPDMIVGMKYTLRDAAGTVLDASEEAPLHYLQGHQNIIPGLERELAGLKVGDSKKIVVAAVDGYGEQSDDLLFSLPRAQFDGQAPEPGMMVQMESEEGAMMATIVSVDEQQITLDANHPLAGKELHFEVTIAEIRAASAEELSHGHPHGPDGHHH